MGDFIDTITTNDFTDGKITCFHCCFPIRLHPLIALIKILQIDFVWNVYSLIGGFATLSIFYSSEKYQKEWQCTWHGCSPVVGIWIITCSFLVCCIIIYNLYRINDKLHEPHFAKRIKLWIWLGSFYYWSGIIASANIFIRLLYKASIAHYRQKTNEDLDHGGRILTYDHKTRFQGSYYHEIYACVCGMISESLFIGIYGYLIELGNIAGYSLKLIIRDRNKTEEFVTSFSEKKEMNKVFLLTDTELEKVNAEKGPYGNKRFLCQKTG